MGALEFLNALEHFLDSEGLGWVRLSGEFVHVRDSRDICCNGGRGQSGVKLVCDEIAKKN